MVISGMGITIWCLVIPLAASITLYKKRWNLRLDKTMEKYGILYLGLRRHWYLWEILKLCLKFSLLLVNEFEPFSTIKVIASILKLIANNYNDDTSILPLGSECH